MGQFSDVDGGPMRVELRSIDGRSFRLLRRIVYQADDYPDPFIIPADMATFHTDLASVPWFFRWLIPRSGHFLPAAILHDGLIYADTYWGPAITRPQADHLFRRALRDLGTGTVRSWLMWAAVTMATMWQLPRHRWYWRGVVAGLLCVVTGLGILATIDLLGAGDYLPWMPEHSLRAQLLGGAAGALLIPPVLALSWGPKFARAGIITGVALAFLVHVTIAVVSVYAVYWLLERLISGPQAAGASTS